MQSPAIESRSTPLGHSQRTALISLLADEDPEVYQAVRTKLLSFAPNVTNWLQPYTLSDDPIMRRRAREIVRQLEQETADASMEEFCRQNGENLDLEKACFLLAQTEYPDCNAEAYGALLDSWANDIRKRISGMTSPDRTLETMNDYLFQKLKFSGNVQYSSDPECSYLNKVIDNRSGNPISLCTIYLFIARRLKLPISGIGLANHFICRYQSPTREIFIDVFRRGRFWTKGDCVKHLLRVHQTIQVTCIAPVPPRRMLLRMCANLHCTYSHLELSLEANRVQKYILALSR